MSIQNYIYISYSHSNDEICDLMLRLFIYLEIGCLERVVDDYDDVFSYAMNDRRNRFQVHNSHTRVCRALHPHQLGTHTIQIFLDV